MAIQISKMMMLYIESFLIIMAILDGIALGLVSRRRDAEYILDDLAKYITKHRFPFNFISLVLLFLVLPFSIPFSIAHLLRK